MSCCELCWRDDEPTEPFTRVHKGATIVERLCGDCWRWSDYWETLTPIQRQRQVEAFHGDAA